MDTPDVSYEDIICDYEDTGFARAYTTAKMYGLTRFVTDLRSDEAIDMTDKFLLAAAFLERLAGETSK
jgi:hypothetical protein